MVEERSDRRPPSQSHPVIESDITIYGATGFVARYVALYILSVSTLLPRSLRVTLAGRNETKLKNLQSDLRLVIENIQTKEGGGEDKQEKRINNAILDIYVADAADKPALRLMSQRTNVVLNCAGPFERYGTNVVGACAGTGTDYIDITGEVTWAGTMREQYGLAAGESGARIISFCGFDSIPSDMAIWAAVRALRDGYEKKGLDGRAVNIEHGVTWFAMMGLMNGGTLHTALDMKVDVQNCAIDPDTGSVRRVSFLVDDPFHLTPKTVKGGRRYSNWKDGVAWGEWTNQLLGLDEQLGVGTWWGGVSVPFLMAPVNAKVVAASAVSLQYGEGFTYGERFVPLGFGVTKVLGFLSVVPALVFQIGLGVATLVFKAPIVGKRLAMWLMPPGTGSPDFLNNRGYTDVYAEVVAPCGVGRVDRGSCRMHFEGDPGNLITAQCVSESALCLVFDRAALPPRSDDGFGTPAELLGKTLMSRLLRSPFRPVKVETGVVWNDRRYKWEKYVVPAVSMGLTWFAVRAVWDQILG